MRAALHRVFLIASFMIHGALLVVVDFTHVASSPFAIDRFVRLLTRRRFADRRKRAAARRVFGALGLLQQVLGKRAPGVGLAELEQPLDDVGMLLGDVRRIGRGAWVSYRKGPRPLTLPLSHHRSSMTVIAPPQPIVTWSRIGFAL